MRKLQINNAANAHPSHSDNWITSSIQKVITIITLLVVITLGLVACGTDTVSPSSSSANSPNAAANLTTTSAATNTTMPTVAVPATATTAGASGSTPAAKLQAAVPVTATSEVTSTRASGSTTLKPTGNLEVDVRNVVVAIKPAVVLIAVSTPQAQGVGTGSIITPDGYIITNFHVVAADSATVSAQVKVQVVMTDGTKYPARIVGTDRSNDLAVVKIDGSNLPTLKLGTSSALQVGDWVVAVGNALALPGGPTVTAGIVGALGRSIQEPAPASANLTDLIQTSAAINPGNSGGPLLNLSGEIVGINTAAPVDPQSQTAAQGIGFAISIDQANPIIQTLMTGQSIVPPYMGILPETLTPGLAAQYNLPTDTGILIQQVEQNSPAAQAGWKAGDTLTEMDGTKLTSIADLQGVLNRHKPGETVKATVISSDGTTRQTTLTFGQPPSQ